MKKWNWIVMTVLAMLCMVPAMSHAGGGFSSGGGSRGGFSSSRSSFSSGSSFRSSPSSYSSRSYSGSSPARSTTVINRTTVNRNYGSGGYYGGYGHPMMMGGMGMGYGYSNGLINGMILGHLMFPPQTTVYSGPGQYAGNAMLLPTGVVADQNGKQVGTYQNGVFTPVDGGMVAQPAPQPPIAQPEDDDPTLGEVLGVIAIIVLFEVFVAIIF